MKRQISTDSDDCDDCDISLMIGIMLPVKKRKYIHEALDILSDTICIPFKSSNSILGLNPNNPIIIEDEILNQNNSSKKLNKRSNHPNNKIDTMNKIDITNKSQSLTPLFKNHPNEVFKILESGHYPGRLVNLIDYGSDKDGIFWYIDFLNDSKSTDSFYEYEKNLVPYEMLEIPRNSKKLMLSLGKHKNYINLHLRHHIRMVKIATKSQISRDDITFLKTIWKYLYLGVDI